MARTLRSQKLRALLWMTTEGICPRCRVPLPEHWHADHVIPWRSTHRTNACEMQPLCADCNRKKGASS